MLKNQYFPIRFINLPFRSIIPVLNISLHRFCTFYRKYWQSSELFYTIYDYVSSWVSGKSDASVFSLSE